MRGVKGGRKRVLVAVEGEKKKGGPEEAVPKACLSQAQPLRVPTSPRETKTTQKRAKKGGGEKGPSL